MKNKTGFFAIDDCKAFKIKMLNWSARFNIFCFLDNNQYDFEGNVFEWIVGAGCKQSVTLTSGNNLEHLQAFSEKNSGWLFGHFGYNVLNNNPHPPQVIPEVDFGDGFFFIPEIVLKLQQSNLIIETDHYDLQQIFDQINEQSPLIKPAGNSGIHFTKRLTEQQYKNILTALKQHILRGDCYEINFCQDFFASGSLIDPLFFYNALSIISPNPFSAFYKLGDKYCLCASPERFLRRSANRLVSQPIKGTSRRHLYDKAADEANKNYLMYSSKEKSENVMVVDIVRNDLSKICKEGSVHVKELFGIYSFPQVYQMISTIEGEVEPDTRWTDIIKACFPMGSMTGAPKKRVMELIAQYEQSPRGLFSGSVGYVDPNGDFDFNVVIRSLMYDETKKFISFKAGGGITFNSDINQEYEECLLKAEAIMRVLKNV